MRSRLVPIRLVFLFVLNLLIVGHVYAYYRLGLTGIGCIDFFGLGSLLAHGTVTAGTIFVLGLIVLTLLLGRIFCGWGCHFALFQDVLFRLFKRVGIQPSFRRSRLEWVLPPFLLFMTILYPIVQVWRRGGLPQSTSVDLGYPEVWHFLPGVKGTLLLLVVDVVILTLFFGGRAFCRYLCPYGLFLKFFHWLSPARIVKIGSCSDCGSCYQVCPTGVPIKAEIESHGLIRDLNCMNCLDCVAACPDGALGLRMTRAAYATVPQSSRWPTSQPMWAEATMLATAVAGFYFYRGREYGEFLAIAMGLVVGAVVVMIFMPERFIRASWLRGRSLRRVRYVAVAVALYLGLGLVGQASGHRALARLDGALARGDADAALQTAAAAARWDEVLAPFTFYLDDFTARAGRGMNRVFERANTQLERGEWAAAERLYRIVVTVQPDRAQAWGNLGTTLYKQHRYFEAAQGYLRVLDTDPNDLIALYHLAMTKVHLGDPDGAVRLIEKILSIDTDGSMFDLIRANPEFKPLERSERYQRIVAVRGGR